MRCGKPGPNADLFRVIEKLNDVRNQLVHSLKMPSEIQKEVNDFINCFYSKMHKKRNPSWSTDVNLTVCLCGLARFLFSARLHLFHLEQS